MSLMALKRGMSRFMIPIGIVMVLAMVVSIAYTGLGTVLAGGGARNSEATKQEAEKPIANVGDIAVTRGDLDSRVDRMIKQQQVYGSFVPTAAMVAAMRVQTLQGYKTEAALVNLAKAVGINPTEADISRARDEVWAQQRGQFIPALGLAATATDGDIDTALAKQGTRATVSALKAQFPENQLRLLVYQKALLAKYKRDVKATPDIVKRSYSEVKVRHILIATGKTGLPEGQAKARAEKILALVKADVGKMPELAKQYSDDPGSKSKGGFYDWAPASKYVPEFGNAALDAGDGKLYPELVKTSFGFHIIKNEGIRPGKDMPKDFATNSQKYVDEYATGLAQQKLQTAVSKASDTVTINVTDPLLHAMQLQTESQVAMSKAIRDQKLMQAVSELGKVEKANDPSGLAPQIKADIYQTLKMPKEAIAAYTESLDYQNTVDTRLALADLYLKQKDKPNAVAQLEKASDLAVSDIQKQFRLAALFKAADRPDLADKAQAKGQEMLKRQAAQMEAAQKAAAKNGQLPPGMKLPNGLAVPGR